MNLTEIKSIKSLFSEPKKIALITHRNPDGDAYGSSLALYNYFKNDNHQVTVVSPNDCPDFLKWMPGQEEIVIFENNITEGTKILEEAQIVFVLDFNAFHRAGHAMQAVLEKINPIYFLIDHHQEPDSFAEYTYVDVEVCSTCQMIYQFLEELDDLEKINKDIATCLYTGILTDTGSFRFPSTTSKTHVIAADLLERGVEHDKIYNIIHENSINRLKLLGKALNNMHIIKKYHTAYITLSNSELQQYNYQKGDTEGFVNYALSLSGIVLAAIFIEDRKQGIIKISFRSIGDFSVNELSRKYFNGGGHINAAGGRSEKSLKETVDDFIYILPEFAEKLNKNNE